MDVPELNLQGLENLRLPSIGDGLIGGGSGSLAALPASQVAALNPQVIDAPLVPSTSAGVTRLERVEVTGTGGYAYADGRGASIGDRIAGDGTRVRLYADGYSTSALDGSVSFKRADMSGLGVSTPLGGSALSAAEYEGVTDRAAWLNSNYDSPGTWHDIKATVDGWFGITPNPVRSSAQEAELAALQGIIHTRLDSRDHWLAFNEWHANRVQFELWSSQIQTLRSAWKSLALSPPMNTTLRKFDLSWTTTTRVGENGNRGAFRFGDGTGASSSLSCKATPIPLGNS